MWDNCQGLMGALAIVIFSLLLHGGGATAEADVSSNDLDNSVRVLTEELEYNQLIDVFITDVVNSLRRSGIDDLTLPEIDRDVDKEYIYRIFPVRFIAMRGYIRDVTTLYRVSDVNVVERNGTGAVIQFDLALRNLTMGYKAYRYSVGNIFRASIGLSGKFHADAGSANKFRAIVFVKKENDKGCSLRLIALKVKTLSWQNADITGFGLMNKKMSKRALMMLNENGLCVARQLVQILGDFISDALEYSQCSI